MSDTEKTLVVNEIFYSIQGESSFAGLPCVFVRLTGCRLRCRYCDTGYAFFDGSRQTLHQVVDQVQKISDKIGTVLSPLKLVEITGGEPLLQPNVHDLMTQLCDEGWAVLLETSGSCDISVCDSRVHRVVDFKTPGSGHMDDNLWSNVDCLGRRDEAKFVICSRMDYDWAVEVLAHHKLEQKVGSVLFSPVTAVPAGRELPGVQAVSPVELAGWILDDRLPVRFQLQLHKIIWGPDVRGV